MRTVSSSWMRRRCAAIVLVAGFVVIGATSTHGTTPPNILLILTDDQGWTDTSAQMDPNVPGSKSGYYQTPNIEALANAGMRFSNGYSAAPQCAQTRASLMTGKSPAQLQMTTLVWYFNGSEIGLPLTTPLPQPFDPTQTTIPRMVKQADPNYQTALMGKWHLEYPASTTPVAAGFDTWQVGGNSSTDPQGVFKLAQQTNAFMENAVQNGKPFFVQLSHDAVHELYRGDGSAYIPARQELVDKYNALPKTPTHGYAPYAALLEDMDTSIGQVLNKLTELGVEDNTYVIFTSDNGATIKYSSNAPLKSGKTTLYEGGIRVPFIVKGPGVQPGTFSDVPVVTADLMSTIASLAGYSGAMPEGNEGADISPVLFNSGQLPQGMEYLDRQYSERGEIYFHYPHYAFLHAAAVARPASAVRDGDFKLYVEYDEIGQHRLYLYNLETDIGEGFNLAAQMPEKTAELKGMLDSYLTAVDASMAYDMKAPMHLAWNAAVPGTDAKGWRSTTDIDNKVLETWALGAGTERPEHVSVQAYQPGVGDRAFSFDGGDIMRRVFFRVGDDRGRNTNIRNIDVGTPDDDRSASFDMWFRTNALNRNQILFEAGNAVAGVSLTLGDADANGSFNDLRFRVRSASGQAFDITTPINAFANPTADFVNATAVISDVDADRYIELYLNGALAGRVNVPTGAANSIDWDGIDQIDQAGIGKAAGGLGGSGGSGNLPFNGAFVGQMALMDFWNQAVAASAIAQRYNAKLDHVGLGIQNSVGGAVVPGARPTDLRLGARESGNLLVFEERRGATTSPIMVNALVSPGAASHYPNSEAPVQLAGGTDFTSYLLHFDPQGAVAGEMRTVSGSVTFAEDIRAIVFDDIYLAASDAIVGSIGNYGAMDDRGVTWHAGDFVTVDDLRRTLTFNLSVAADDMLQFRVLTGAFATTVTGDFNGDGIVDGGDLSAWQSAYGQSPLADSDGDGDSDGNDFLAWQQNVGASLPQPTAAVPEPATLAGLTLALGASALARRASRKPRS